MPTSPTSWFGLDLKLQCALFTIYDVSYSPSSYNCVQSIMVSFLLILLIVFTPTTANPCYVKWLSLKDNIKSSAISNLIRKKKEKKVCSTFYLRFEAKYSFVKMLMLDFDVKAQVNHLLMQSVHYLLFRCSFIPQKLLLLVQQCPPNQFTPLILVAVVKNKAHQ